jgi:hypothetical protein
VKLSGFDPVAFLWYTAGPESPLHQIAGATASVGVSDDDFKAIMRIRSGEAPLVDESAIEQHLHEHPDDYEQLCELAGRNYVPKLLTLLPPGERTATRVEVAWTQAEHPEALLDTETWRQLFTDAALPPIQGG